MLGLALLRRGGPTAAVLVVAGAVQLTPLGAPLLLSSDAWTYWGYGRLAAVHGENPYRVAPSAFPEDPAYRWIGSAWKDETSVYGPAFTLASEPAALAAGSSADGAAWLFKGVAAAALIAATVLAARTSAFAAAFVGWNPLLALHGAGGGHNDAWVGALVLGALVSASAGRRQLAGVGWALAVLVKWVPLVLLPLRALEARATGRRIGHLGFALAGAALLALASLRYGLGWLEAFGPLARNAANTTRFALPHRVVQLGVPERLAVALFALAFVAAYAWLVREALRGRARLGLTAALLVLASPYVAPWYLAWVVPLAAVEEDRAARALTLALCAYLLPQTLPV